jgi:hypothetical protein
MVDKWAPKIDTDEDIEAYITDEDRVELLTEAAAEANRIRTEVKKEAAKGNPNPGKKGENTDEPDPDEIDETKLSPFERTLLKTVGGLKKDLDTFKTSQTQQTLAERFKNHPDLKNVPAFMMKGRTPKTEEEFDTAVEELKTDYTDYAKENKLPLIGADTPPGANKGKQEQQGDDGKVSAEVMKFAQTDLAPKAEAGK